MDTVVSGVDNNGDSGLGHPREGLGQKVVQPVEVPAGEAELVSDGASLVEVVENTLRSMQELVDGPIECVTVTEDLAIVCNEEGRIRGLSPSASILRMQFVGPVAFVGVRGEDFMSITRKGERLVRQIVKEAEI